MARKLSTHEKDMVGSRAKRKTTPKPHSNMPKPPVWIDLLGDKQAAREAASWWRATVPELDRSGILTRIDDVVVTEAAVCWARIRQCERELGRSGLLIEGQKGNLVRNPVSLTLSSYRQSMATYLKHLGLSPAARQGMDITAPRRALNVLDKIRIASACQRRAISIAAADVPSDPAELDLAGVPDDIAAEWR